MKEMRKSIDEQLLDFERAERIAREERISAIRRAKNGSTPSNLRLVEREETEEDIIEAKKSNDVR